tara:strand:- start:290 stop:484 length:195 start_codon:yes stop_codon:yes gene_type:complete
MDIVIKELFEGYANGLITDRECGDMLDLVTNTYTVVVDNKVEMDWESDMEHEHYDLEASQYDYI